MTEPMDKILLVDDEQHLLISLKDYLVSEKFNVITARSGEEAIAQLDDIKPNLIILDISMPGMGGLGFLKRISTPEGKTTHPVLVLTARSMMESFFDSVSVAGFLTKPCDETRLVRTMRKILAANRKKQPKQTDKIIKVLLAEDDPLLARDIMSVLAAAGYDVVPVDKGPEVLDKAISIKPDAIIMKEVLPRLNGSSVAGLIEVMPSLSGIPIVLYDERLNGIQGTTPRPSIAKCVKQSLSTNKPEVLLAALQAVLNP